MNMRIWPGVVIAVVMVLVRVIAPLVPDGSMAAVLGPLAGGVLIFLWWLFFSRARWTERIGVILLLVAAGFASQFIVHPSIRGGLMGRMVPVLFAIPGLALALVVWAAATRRLGSPSRYAALVAIVAATCGLFALVRTDGLLGGVPQITWRWTPTAEDRLLAQAASEPLPPAAAEAPAPPASAPAPVTAAEDPAAT